MDWKSHRKKTVNEVRVTGNLHAILNEDRCDGQGKSIRTERMYTKFWSNNLKGGINGRIILK
jgi:hypothetical protein